MKTWRRGNVCGGPHACVIQHYLDCLLWVVVAFLIMEYNLDFTTLSFFRRYEMTLKTTESSTSTTINLSRSLCLSLVPSLKASFSHFARFLSCACFVFSCSPHGFEHSNPKQGFDCSLREAAIIGSVITKKSVPVLHSCAALLKIAELEYHPANMFFVKFATSHQGFFTCC